MSWASYVSSLEQGKGQCKYAGIWGKPPAACWAESADKSEFPITADDVNAIARAIISQDMNIMGTGIKIGGKLSFTCLRLEPGLLICQGKGENKDHSLVVAVSIQTVIIGFNSDPNVKTATLRDNMEGTVDYLRNNGF